MLRLRWPKPYLRFSRRLMPVRHRLSLDRAQRRGRTLLGRVHRVLLYGAHSIARLGFAGKQRQFVDSLAAQRGVQVGLQRRRRRIAGKRRSLAVRTTGRAARRLSDLSCAALSTRAKLASCLFSRVAPSSPTVCRPSSYSLKNWSTRCQQSLIAFENSK